MKFKEFYTEGRNKWNMFELKKCDKRWSFVNTESGQRYFIKMDEPNNVSNIQKFLEDVMATDDTTPKTKNPVDFKRLATEIISGNKTKIHIKSGKWENLKSTWILDKKM